MRPEPQTCKVPMPTDVVPCRGNHIGLRENVPMLRPTLPSHLEASPPARNHDHHSSQTANQGAQCADAQSLRSITARGAPRLCPDFLSVPRD
jgi:hypothetical protein